MITTRTISPKISVVVPTYRRPQLLLRCIDALLEQTFPGTDYEIIIVSDGYDGETFDAISKYRNRGTPAIKYHHLKQKGGPAAARNKGWQFAIGELIAFTDDDCIPQKDWLSQFWQAYTQQKAKAVAFTGKTVVPISKTPTDYERNIAQLEKAEFITANCACTKKAMLAVGGFDEEFTMAWREDSDLQFKLLENNIPIYSVDYAQVTHPVRKAPWGVSIKEERKGIFNALLFKKHPRLYRERIRSSLPWQYYSIAIFLLVLLIGITTHQRILIMTGAGGWLLTAVSFALKRLLSTSHSIKHISEMLITSMIIPFLSLYYRIYGCLKYKVPLLR